MNDTPRRRSPGWYDAQYDARAGIPDQARIRQGWFERSARARAMLPCTLDVPYGPHASDASDAGDASERLDIFHPGGPSAAPVLVYIHGGYWRALDKSDVSFVAPAFTQAGAMVVVPN
jgi:arylformamidase